MSQCSVQFVDGTQRTYSLVHKNAWLLGMNSYSNELLVQAGLKSHPKALKIYALAVELAWEFGELEHNKVLFELKRLATIL